MTKRKSIEPRIYSSKNCGVIYDALNGDTVAIQEVIDINCFVPFEDFNHMRYIVALLFYLGRLS